MQIGGGMSRFEVGPLEFALVLLLNAGERVQAVKGAKAGSISCL